MHHEHILEASERFEESTYRGSVVKNSMVESRRFTIDKAPDGMMDSIQIKSSMKSSSNMDDSDLVVEKRKGSYD